VNNYSNSPNTQPYRSIQAKLWQVVGLVLIGGGLLVMGWTGWMYYQQQAELINPPAPIIDSAAIETSDPPASPLESTEPLAIAQSNVDDSQPATATPTPTPRPESGDDPALAEENTSSPTPTTEMPTREITPTDVIQVSTSDEEALVPLEASVDDVPSLADNPLLMVEDVDETEALDQAPQNPAASPPTRLVAPSINLDTPVVETGWVQVEKDGVVNNVWVVADYAAGWHQNSSLPGEGGNIVLSGHHNIKGEVFRYIVELEVGDTVSLFVGDQQYDYVVNDKFIVKDKGEPDSVRRANAKWIGPFNEERLTLVTCWPYNNNTHRVIVIAKPKQS